MERKRIYHQAKGNISLLVLVDSSKKKEYQIVDETMYAAFEHLGMPYEVLDLAEDSSSINDKFLYHSGIVIAQERLGSSLSEEFGKAISHAVSSGVGLVNLGGNEGGCNGPLKEVLGISNIGSLFEVSRIKITNNSHYITYNQDEGCVKNLRESIQVPRLSLKGNGLKVLIESNEGDPILFVKRQGKGKIVNFLLPPRFWLKDYFGHVGGLDDVFWKSIVWASKKPFLMKAMPPFVAARIDDASGRITNSPYEDICAQRGYTPTGSYLNFGYIDIMNKHGYIPEVGLFIDDITEEGARKIKSLSEAGLAEFSPHAFTYAKRIYAAKGTHGYSEGSAEQRFSEVDRKLAQWGIWWRKSVNLHYYEYDADVLPLLKERGVRFLMNPAILAGEKFLGEHKDWNPAPYGHYGCIFDFYPTDSDFFFVISWPASSSLFPNKLYEAQGYVEFMSGNTIYDGRPFNDLEVMAKKGANAIRLGLDSMFFGRLFTHEQRIRVISPHEWEMVLTKIDELTSRYDKIYKGYDYIAEYARNKVQSSITEVNYIDSGKRITCSLEGRTTRELYLYVFRDEDEKVKYKLELVPAFAESTMISIQM